jgi:hypothetical protein
VRFKLRRLPPPSVAAATTCHFKRHSSHLQYYDGGAGDDGGRPGLRCEEKAALFLVLSLLIKQLLQRTQANGMSSEGFTDNAIQKAECGQKECPVAGAAAITGSSAVVGSF